LWAKLKPGTFIWGLAERHLKELIMRTVSIFRNNRNQAIRLPKEFEYPGVTELAIEKHRDTIVLRPVRPSWTSFADEPLADADFLRDRPDLVEEGRFAFDEEENQS
jgi:antitoxin VapB